jgi:transposase-like protein
MQYTQQKLSDHTNTKLEFAEWLRKEQFICNNPPCSVCGTPTQLQNSTHFDADGVCYRCLSCKRYFSIRNNTYWNHDGKLSIESQLRMLVAYASKATVSSTAKQWDISRPTVSNYFTRFRNAVVGEVDFLIGSGLYEFGYGTVEVDEALFQHLYDDDKKSYIDKQWVIALKHRESGLLWLERVLNRKTQSLMPVVRAHVSTGSVVCTDELASYNGMEDDGLFHYSVNHSANEYARDEKHPLTGELFTVTTNGCEALWADLRARVHNPAHRTLVHIDRAMSEMMFGFAGLSVFDLFKESQQ